MQPNILFCNLLLLSCLVNIGLSVSYASMCSRSEKEKDRKREEMEREEGNVLVQLSRFFRKTHMARRFHKPLRTTQRQLFSFTTVVFIYFAYTLKCLTWGVAVKVHQRTEVRRAVSIFIFPSLTGYMFHLHIIHNSFVGTLYNVNVTQKCVFIMSLIFS